MKLPRNATIAREGLADDADAQVIVFFYIQIWRNDTRSTQKRISAVRNFYCARVCLCTRHSEPTSDKKKEGQAGAGQDTESKRTKK